MHHELEKNSQTISAGTNTVTVLDYHERTKHRFDGYARGPGTLDWEAQPSPFRHFAGAPQRPLPLQKSNEGPSYAELFSGKSITSLNWNETTISQLLQFSLALSAWKQFGNSRWSLRCNPSSGNLHPTETYLIIIAIDGFEDGLYHYCVDQHQLELRCRYPNTEVLNKQALCKQPLLLLGFSSVPWREAWKYGERALRYTQHDLGHALAALSYAAATLGCEAKPIHEIGTVALQQLLGLERSDEFYADEAEYGDMLVSLHPAGETHPYTDSLIEALLQLCGSGEWHGRANRLDSRHLYKWPLVDEVANAVHSPARPSEQKHQAEFWPGAIAAAEHPLSQQSARTLFLQRRSAQAFDANATMTSDDFFRLMDRLLPRSELPPWSAQTAPGRIHIVVFVHSVEGLAPGLYAMPRRRAALDTMKAELREDLLWEVVDNAPTHLPFYRLVKANARRAAMKLSCQQAIAGDGVFSLSMLAEFEPVVGAQAWRYKDLFCEAGMTGQSLYLEAEAIGMRGTGIGCFFDDPVHETLGLQGKTLQSIYHFTVGAPINDARLASLAPYSSTSSCTSSSK
jgi:SagB-type dehydrogenase family enzyme